MLDDIIKSYIFIYFHLASRETKLSKHAPGPHGNSVISLDKNYDVRRTSTVLYQCVREQRF